MVLPKVDSRVLVVDKPASSDEEVSLPEPLLKGEPNEDSELE